ncbi:MAG: hypothetical protein K2K82_00650 [Muribaculaceae bacterium]|nr:hypothetical protein [Muribaculaceae bacterium]
MRNKFLAAAASVSMSDALPKVKEYALMYLFGAWVTAEKFCAENDAEAVFEADRLPKVAADKLEYALFCGNRRVKTYSRPAAARITTIKL